jgi:hypothetical protein
MMLNKKIDCILGNLIIKKIAAKADKEEPIKEKERVRP